MFSVMMLVLMALPTETLPQSTFPEPLPQSTLDDASLASQTDVKPEPTTEEKLRWLRDGGWRWDSVKKAWWRPGVRKEVQATKPVPFSSSAQPAHAEADPSAAVGGVRMKLVGSDGKVFEDRVIKGEKPPGGPDDPPRLPAESAEEQGFTVPAGFIPYQRARHTQEIAVTNGFDRITPVPRSRLEAKWQVSGGMVGLKGWKSEVYQFTPETGAGRQFVADIAVWNGSNYQNNRGWRRSYNDGVKFMDVLSNTTSGKVFEARLAEKNGGRWTREVVYRDPAEHPKGYRPVSRENCKECHNKFPGTGNYAGPLVSGADTVFSFPFKALDRGLFD